MPSSVTERIRGVLGGVAIKPPCKAVAAVNVTRYGERTVGSEACFSGDRVLLTGQSDAVENGIWVVDTGDWSRALDFNGARDVVTGTIVLIAPGTFANIWQVSTSGDIFPGTTPISFIQIDPFAQSVSGGYGIDPRSLGAVGDGVADDTPWIQAALSLVSFTAYQGSLTSSYAKGGGAVRLSPGKYRITDTLRIGANTEFFGSSVQGNTLPSVDTGSVLICDFPGDKKRWAISSATYEIITDAGSGMVAGRFAPFNTVYSGAQHDAGSITYTMGIKVHGLFIKGNGAYGGIRLMGSSDFDLHNCMVDNCAVTYLLNTSYGGRYGAIHSRFDLYGLVIYNCTAYEAGNSYLDHVYSTWAIDNTTRLVPMADLGPGNGAFMPDWSQKRFGILQYGCFGFSMPGTHTAEHADVGVAMVQCHSFTANFYTEGNGDSNFGAVSCSGAITGLFNGTTSGTKYHFGVNNNLTLTGCSSGGVYVGNAQNTISIISSDDSAGGAGWTWNDALNFLDLKAFNVSSTGLASTVFGYTTFGEAMRRIAAGAPQRLILIKDGDTVNTDQQTVIDGKSIRIQAETGVTRATLNFAAIGGGFLFRFLLSGKCALDWFNVNWTFPTTPAAVSTDNSAFLILPNSSATVDFNFHGGNINEGAGYGVAHVAAGGSLNWRSAFSDCGITAGTPAGLITMEASGAAVVTNIVAATTLAAGIKAIGVNGWQVSTSPTGVLYSNFP